MHLTLVALFLSLLLPTTLATEHTMCFNYFLGKDGCVVNTPGDKRCTHDPPKATNVQAITTTANQDSSKQQRSLVRRYDTTQPVNGSSNLAIHDVCAGFSSHKGFDPSQPGACLWLGTSEKNISEAGWLNFAKGSNCGKKLWIQRQGDTKGVVYAPVVGACDFSPSKPESACFQIGLTEKTFQDLGPNAHENKTRIITGVISWDFDNAENTHTRNGPV